LQFSWACLSGDAAPANSQPPLPSPNGCRQTSGGPAHRQSSLNQTSSIKKEKKKFTNRDLELTWNAKAQRLSHDADKIMEGAAPMLQPTAGGCCSNFSLKSVCSGRKPVAGDLSSRLPACVLARLDSRAPTCHATSAGRGWMLRRRRVSQGVSPWSWGGKNQMKSSSQQAQGGCQRGGGTSRGPVPAKHSDRRGRISHSPTAGGPPFVGLPSMRRGD
jgi:hypothetical protein